MRVVLTKTLRSEIKHKALTKSGLRDKLKNAKKALFDLVIETIRNAYGPERYDAVVAAQNLLLKLGNYSVYTYDWAQFVIVDGQTIKVFSINSYFSLSVNAALGKSNAPEITREQYELISTQEKVCDAIEKELAALESTLESTLAGFRTIKSLLDAWPEAQELLPESCASVKKLPIVVPRESLNAALKLSSEK